MADIHPVGVIHGRFQILHNDHLKYLLAGRQRCRHLVVGITNPDPSLTRAEASNPERSGVASNPLSYFERQALIRAALTDAGVALQDFTVVPLPINVPELYGHYVPLDAAFFLTIYDDWGREKLERFKRLGLRTEILWERTAQEKGISGCDVRARMREGRDWKQLVPSPVAALLQQWDIPTRLNNS